MSENFPRALKMSEKTLACISPSFSLSFRLLLFPFFAIHSQDANHTVALTSRTLSRYCLDTSESFHLAYIRVGERVDERGIERTEYNVQRI